MRRSLQKYLKWIKKSADRWWFAPAMAFLSALDAYILIVPNETIIAASVLARRKRWISLVVWMTIGSALGALSLAALLNTQSEHVLGWFGDMTRSQEWRDSVRVIDRHGVWGLALISLSPFPQHAAVILVGLLRMSLWKVFLGVLLGRAPKYFGIGWLAVKSPDVLRRWNILTDK